jgi:hypothetical protein
VGSSLPQITPGDLGYLRPGPVLQVSVSSRQTTGTRKEPERRSLTFKLDLRSHAPERTTDRLTGFRSRFFDERLRHAVKCAELRVEVPRVLFGKEILV